jgi:hypothetical protein
MTDEIAVSVPEPHDDWRFRRERSRLSWHAKNCRVARLDGDALWQFAI